MPVEGDRGVGGVAMADLRLSQPVAEERAREGWYERLGADLEGLMRGADDDYSDLTVVVGGKRLPLHRCILAARCPGLRKALRDVEQTGNVKLELDLNSVVENSRPVGYEAFMALMGYVYGGKLQPWPVAVPCHDSSCSHLTCRPAIDFVLEILSASTLFNVPEVKAVAEVLVDIVLGSSVFSGLFLWGREWWNLELDEWAYVN